jgi:hypothetical protein
MVLILLRGKLNKKRKLLLVSAEETLDELDDILITCAAKNSYKPL